MHWYREINRHIVFIDPNEGRIIPDEDAQSLLKFSRLECLDVTPFCRRGRYEVKSERCSYIMRILHQLPRLTAVNMDARVLSAATKNDIEGLRLKRIRLSGTIESLDDLLKLSTLTLEELGVPYFELGCLAHFLATIPSLKWLDIALPRVENDDLEALASLDRVGTEYHGQHPSQLSAVTSLVRLCITSCPIDELEPFRQMRILRELDPSIGSSDVFDDAFWSVMMQLTYLKLSSGRRYLALPPRFWEIATVLTKLRLNIVRFDSDAFLQQDFSHLHGLELWSCLVDGECISFDRLTALTTLDMSRNRGQDQPLQQGYMDPTPLKRLRELEVNFNDMPDLTDELLYRISQLPNLESLRLWNVWRRSDSDPIPYDAFESLGKLTQLSKLVIGIVRQEEVSFADEYAVPDWHRRRLYCVQGHR